MHIRRLPLLGVLSVLALSGQAFADPIGFGYDFTTPQAVTGDSNLGTIAFATTNGSTATGPAATLTAASLTAISSGGVHGSVVNTFSGKTYDVKLALTDQPSGQSGSLTFVGSLSGSLTATAANITTTFSAPTQTLVLGSDQYTVTIGPLVPPTSPNPTVVGTLMATVDVQSAVKTHLSPEPSTMVLAGLGLASAVVGRQVRRRRTPT